MKPYSHDIHRLINLIHREIAMYLLERQPRILHSLHSLLIDIRRLDTTYLPLNRHNLVLCLLQRVLHRLLSPQCRLCCRLIRTDEFPR